MARYNIQISVSVDGAKKAKTEIKQLGDQSKRTSKDVSTFEMSLGKLKAAAVGMVSAAVFIQLGRQMARFAADSVRAYGVQEKAIAQLEAGLKSTGGAVGWTSKELQKMASEMQRTTTYGDELTISAQAVLLSFTKIGKEAFPRAMQAAADVATRMGTDLQSAVVQLGKALNDPVANLGELSRAGIQFTKEQKELIKELWESGRALEAQTIILDELESQYGGSAAAAANTFTGRLEQLTNQLGDMKEQIGEIIARFVKPFLDFLMESGALVTVWHAAMYVLNVQIEIFLERADRLLRVAGWLTDQMGQDGASGALKLFNAILQQSAKGAEEAEGRWAQLREEMAAVARGTKTSSNSMQLDISAMDAALDKFADTAEETSEKVEAATEAMDAHVRVWEEWRAAVDDWKESVRSLIDNLLPADRLTREYAKDVKLLQEALQEGEISVDTYNRAIEALNKNYEEGLLQQYPEVVAALDEIKRAYEELAQVILFLQTLDPSVLGVKGGEAPKLDKWANYGEAVNRAMWDMRDAFKDLEDGMRDSEEVTVQFAATLGMMALALQKGEMSLQDFIVALADLATQALYAYGVAEGKRPDATHTVGGQQYGGIRTGGDYADTGGQVGMVIGAVIGTIFFGATVIGAAIGKFLGTLIGSMVKRGQTDLEMTFNDGLNTEYNQTIIKMDKEAREFAEAWGTFFKDSIDQFVEGLGLIPVELADSMIDLRGDTMEVWVNGLHKTFTDMEEAMEFLLLETLKGSTFEGNPYIVQALRNSNAQTMQELADDLNFAKWVERLGMTDLERALDDLEMQFQALMQRAIELDLPLDNLIAWYEAERAKIEAQYNQNRNRGGGDRRQRREDLRQEIEDILDPMGAELRDLDRWFEESRKEAEKLGVDIGELTEAYELQREEIGKLGIVDLFEQIAQYLEDGPEKQKLLTDAAEIRWELEMANMRAQARFLVEAGFLSKEAYNRINNILNDLANAPNPFLPPGEEEGVGSTGGKQPGGPISGGPGNKPGGSGSGGGQLPGAGSGGSGGGGGGGSTNYLDIGEMFRRIGQGFGSLEELNAAYREFMAQINSHPLKSLYQQHIPALVDAFKQAAEALWNDLIEPLRQVRQVILGDTSNPFNAASNFSHLYQQYQELGNAVLGGDTSKIGDLAAIMQQLLGASAGVLGIGGQAALQEQFLRLIEMIEAGGVKFDPEDGFGFEMQKAMEPTTAAVYSVRDEIAGLRADIRQNSNLRLGA